jgi:adenylate cyclase
VSLLPGAGPPDAAASRFLDHLSLELSRYGDARVLVQSGGEAAGKGRCYTLNADLFDEDGSRAVGVRLVDCRTSLQLWADEYREGPPGPHGFHAETARIVAARVASEHGILAQTLWKELPPVGAARTSYDALLRSYRFFFGRDPSDLVPALAALREAVSADPACSPAWVQLSRLHAANHAFEIAPADTSIDQALAFAQNAVRLDPSSPRGHVAHGFVLLLKGEVGAGLDAAHAALATHPQTFVYREMIGWLTALLGEWDRGTALVRETIARNPHHLPIGYHALWADHLRRAEYDKAHQAALRYGDAAFFWRGVMRACSLGHLGRVDEAKAEAAEILRLKPDFSRRGRVLLGRLLKFPDVLEPAIEGLARAGLALD